MELKVGRRTYQLESDGDTVLLKWKQGMYDESVSFTKKNGSYFFNPIGKMGGASLTREQKKVLQDKLNTLMEEGKL